MQNCRNFVKHLRKFFLIEGFILLRLGVIEMFKGNFDISEHYLKKSLKDFQILGFRCWENIALYNLTNYFVYINYKSKAFFILKEGRRNFREVQSV